MGRGKSQKTKVREAASLSVPLLLAEKLAEQQAELKKPWDLILKDAVSTKLKTINIDEIIKLSTWIGLTVIIEPFIENSPLILEKVVAIPMITTPFVYYLFNWLKAQLPEETIPQIRKLDVTPSWILSFVIAGLIIEFGPAILESVGGIGKLAGLLLTA